MIRSVRASKQLRSINCTQCGAPLELRGGHRVESINCGYCGSVLDAKDEYKVLKKYTAEKAQLLLPLGSSGKIKDVEFIVIGVVKYSSYDSIWYEYALYSPTHGYAWIEYEAGHFIFSRRVRDLPSQRITTVEKSTFTARHMKFKVFDSYTAKIDYVEGELTWVAQRGDKIQLIDAICPPYIYTQEKREKELEYVLGEYIPAQQIYTAFKLKGKPEKPSEIHGAQPHEPGTLFPAMNKAAKILLPLNIVLLLLVALFGSGSLVVNAMLTSDDYLQGAKKIPFSVKDPDKLLELDLNIPLDNAWTWCDIEVLNQGEPLFSMSKQISYYSGYEGGESWSEGSQSANAYFKVPEAGDYELHIFGEGGTGEYGTAPQGRNLSVKVREGVIVSRYFLIMAILMLIALLLLPLSRGHFEAKRWGDYEDDDD